MQNKPPLEMFLKRLITAPKAKQTAAVESALALLAGKPPEKMLYTGAEFSRLASFSTQSLWRLVKSGAIVPVKIRGMTRYTRASLERLAGGEGCLK